MKSISTHASMIISLGGAGDVSQNDLPVLEEVLHLLNADPKHLRAAAERYLVFFHRFPGQAAESVFVEIESLHPERLGGSMPIGSSLKESFRLKRC